MLSEGEGRWRDEVERVALQLPSGASQTIGRPALNQILTVEEATN
ncbi:MAG TPA: hypothetical protein VJM31_08050 [Vicinamibacterales bacterium]|nr:hypothetical protein [Vicinamibacterales bacterium]